MGIEVDDTNIADDKILKYNVGTGKFLELGVVGKEVKIEVSLEMSRK